MIIRGEDGNWGNSKRGIGRKARVEDYLEKERHLVKGRRKGVLRLSSRKKVGGKGREAEGGELNRRRWANIAVQRDEGEPRCRCGVGDAGG